MKVSAFKAEVGDVRLQLGKKDLLAKKGQDQQRQACVTTIEEEEVRKKRGRKEDGAAPWKYLVKRGRSLAKEQRGLAWEQESVLRRSLSEKGLREGGGCGGGSTALIKNRSKTSPF